jgi:sugar O-acyltransferase (sialic acid O-acetyltransferase NeuD family)
VRLLVVGAGGHAKVVVDAALAAGFDIAGIVGTAGDAPEILGHPVSIDGDGIDAEGFVVAIGDNATRARVFTEYCGSGLAPVSVIHPSVVLGSDVTIGDGTFIAAGAIINAGARIGADSILNTGCTVDHDCTLGAHVHVGPRAALCGAVALEDGVLVGVGACASPSVRVGAWSVVGAGAAVVDDLPTGTVAVGVPARVTRAIKAPDRG